MKWLLILAAFSSCDPFPLPPEPPPQKKAEFIEGYLQRSFDPEQQVVCYRWGQGLSCLRSVDGGAP